MNKTILVVDDFASVRLYHMTFLQRKGYRCLAASNGDEALKLIETQPVDLVLLDMVMPGMDGPAFMTALSAKPKMATLPILAITSEETQAQAALAAFSNRPVCILSKPVMPGALLSSVQQLLASAPPNPLVPAPGG